jgi:hypothetical protein
LRRRTNNKLRRINKRWMKMQKVHTFDLWDTIVVMKTMGPRVVEAYKELAKDKDPKIVAEVVKNYQAVLEKAEWVGSNKAKYVKDLEEPVWSAYSARALDINTSGVVFDDALKSIDSILTAGEKVHILTTGDSQWILRTLAEIDKSIVKGMKVYFGDKTLEDTFRHTDSYIKTDGGIWISHTEDELKGFKGLTLDCVNKVYIDRKPGKENTTGLVDIYTTDLTKVDYANIKMH